MQIGPYRLVNPLDAGPMADRWVALDERTLATHLAYRVRVRTDRGASRRFLAGVEALSQLKHPHILPVQTFVLGGGSPVGGSTPPGAWVVAPFTGNLDGLVTLRSLLTQKGGRMAPVEVERALMQLLEATEYAHGLGHVHGPLLPEEVLVDPRGSVLIELYGLRRRVMTVMERSVDEAKRDEVRSIVAIGYELLTGVSPDEPLISASRLVPRLGRRWDEWFEMGLNPLSGFGSAGEASAMLPALRRELDVGVRLGPVQSMLSRMRRALRVGE